MLRRLSDGLRSGFLSPPRRRVLAAGGACRPGLWFRPAVGALLCAFPRTLHKPAGPRQRPPPGPRPFLLPTGFLPPPAGFLPPLMGFLPPAACRGRRSFPPGPGAFRSPGPPGPVFPPNLVFPPGPVPPPGGGKRRSVLPPVRYGFFPPPAGGLPPGAEWPLRSSRRPSPPGGAVRRGGFFPVPPPSAGPFPPPGGCRPFRLSGGGGWQRGAVFRS